MATLDGMKEFRDLLEKDSRAFNGEARQKILESGAKPIVERAKSIALGAGGKPAIQPHTKTLSNGIRYEYDSSAKDEISIGWTKEAFYGMFLERGFIHAKSKQFVKRAHLRPAYEETQEQVFDNMYRELEGLL